MTYFLNNFNYFNIVFRLHEQLYLYSYGNNFSKALNIIDNCLYFITVLARTS